MKISILATLATIALSAISSSAAALDAEIIEASGKVLIQKKGSERYLPAKTGTGLSMGDKLMVMENSKVKIAYFGCVESVDGSADVIMVGSDSEDCKESIEAVAGSGSPRIARITDANGRLIVEQPGSGTPSPAGTGTGLHTGDKLTIAESSMAQISYYRCKETVEGSKVFTIDGTLCPIVVAPIPIASAGIAAGVFVLGAVAIGTSRDDGGRPPPASP